MAILSPSRCIICGVCQVLWLLPRVKTFTIHNIHCQSAKPVALGRPIILVALSSNDDDYDEATISNSSSSSSSSSLPSSTPQIRGDAVRGATGVRPSLHPVTINVIAEALKVRAKNLDAMPMRVVVSATSENGAKAVVEPLQVAMSASKLAVDAIEKRQSSSKQDGMKLNAIEEQTIAGRVVGVVMRLDMLEAMLVEKCKATAWISKYNEWSSFGVLGEEESVQAVDDRILSDPLFSVSRAECLLALFLSEVETPSLKQRRETVPGGSEVDFLDADRKQVLLSG